MIMPQNRSEGYTNRGAGASVPEVVDSCMSGFFEFGPQ